MRILLVDDDLYNLDILKTLFEETLGIEVIGVASKREAFKAIDREEFFFVVTDIMLGDGSGFEILEKVKFKSAWTPVIGITGYIEEIENTYMTINFDLLVKKPINFEDFLQKINDISNKFFQFFFFENYEQFENADIDKINKKSFVLTTEEYAEDVQHYLNNKNLDTVGAVLPGFLYNSNIYEKGILLVLMSSRVSGVNICSMSNMNKSDLTSDSSAMVFYDAVTGDFESFCNSYGDIFKGKYALGIGCGDKHLTDAPSVFDKNGFYANSCILFMTSRRLYSEYFLGLNAAAGPLSIIGDKNAVLKINNNNAYDFYMDFYEKTEGKKAESIQVAGLKYPFGFLDNDNTYVPRVPMERVNAGFSFIGDLKSNFEGYLLKYDETNSGKKLEEFLKYFRIKEKVAVPFITYCYGRYVGNKDRFSIKELKTIFKYFEKSNVGVLSHGEIVNRQNNIYKMLNYSVILSNFEV